MCQCLEVKHGLLFTMKMVIPKHLPLSIPAFIQFPGCFVFCMEAQPPSSPALLLQQAIYVHNMQRVLDDDNANHSAAQKPLLLDHQELCHVCVGLIQKLCTCLETDPTPSFVLVDQVSPPSWLGN